MVFPDFQTEIERDIETIKSSENFVQLQESINDSKEFLMILSENMFLQPQVCISSNKTYLLGTELLDSCVKSLHSIENCCIHGSFADANVLARKYRDDLFLYLYIIDVLSKRKGLTEEEIKTMSARDGLDAEKWLKIIELQMSIMVSGTRKNRDDLAIDAWFDNTACKGNFTKELDIKNYLNHIKTDPVINQCVSECELDSLLKHLSRRLNNYTHNNGKIYLERNLSGEIRRLGIEECLSDLSQDLSYITGAFLAILILIKPNAIMASDYIDYLDAGLEPPEDSQYFIAPFVQDYIDKYITKLHPDLKAFLKQNNKYGMLIE